MHTHRHTYSHPINRLKYSFLVVLCTLCVSTYFYRFIMHAIMDCGYLLPHTVHHSYIIYCCLLLTCRLLHCSQKCQRNDNNVMQTNVNGDDYYCILYTHNITSQYSGWNAHLEINMHYYYTRQHSLESNFVHIVHPICWIECTHFA